MCVVFHRGIKDSKTSGKGNSRFKILFWKWENKYCIILYMFFCVFDIRILIHSNSKLKLDLCYCDSDTHKKTILLSLDVCTNCGLHALNKAFKRVARGGRSIISTRRAATCGRLPLVKAKHKRTLCTKGVFAQKNCLREMYSWRRDSWDDWRRLNRRFACTLLLHALQQRSTPVPPFYSQLIAKIKIL